MKHLGTDELYECIAYMQERMELMRKRRHPLIVGDPFKTRTFPYAVR